MPYYTVSLLETKLSPLFNGQSYQSYQQYLGSQSQRKSGIWWFFSK